MDAKAMKEVESENVEENKRGEKVVVDRVNYESSAGKGLEQKNVKVVHQSHPKTSGGVLLGAAAAVEPTLDSAKQAISKT